MSQKLRYLGRSLIGTLTPGRRRCPNCGAADYEVTQRKYAVSSLVRCRHCSLLYRVPTDPPAPNDTFYEQDYESGMTTQLPGADELAALMADSFRGTAKDFSHRLAILEALGVRAGSSVLDFGASWGYGTWQMRQAGYEAVGYELGQTRAAYAREKLGAPVVSAWDEVTGPFDVVFSSHVLEHVADLGPTLDRLRSLVAEGGLFVAFTPSGSDQWRAADPARYKRSWGQLHPCLPDERFYRQVFAGRPMLLASPPYDHAALAAWDRSESVTLDLSGHEIMVAAVA